MRSQLPVDQKTRSQGKVTMLRETVGFQLQVVKRTTGVPGSSRRPVGRPSLRDLGLASSWWDLRVASQASDAQLSLAARDVEPRLASPSSRAASGKRFRLPAALPTSLASQAWELG